MAEITEFAQKEGKKSRTREQGKGMDSTQYANKSYGPEWERKAEAVPSMRLFASPSQNEDGDFYFTTGIDAIGSAPLA